MNPAERQAALESAMERLFELPPERIVPQARLYEDLDIDSIDAIDMLSRLRELTGKALPADELKSVRTVGDVVSLVEAH